MRLSSTSLWPRSAGVLVLLATITYLSWILAPLHGSQLDPIATYVSELAVPDQPTATYVRAADMTTAVLLLSAGALGLVGIWHRGWHRVTRRERLVFVCIMVAALGTLVDIAVPMQCLAHDDTCRAALPWWTDKPHEVASSVVWLGWLIAQVPFVWHSWPWLRRRLQPLDHFPVTTRASAWLIWPCALYGPIAAVLDVWGHYAGIAQRIYLIALAVWMVALSIDLTRAPAPSD